MGCGVRAPSAGGHCDAHGLRKKSHAKDTEKVEIILQIIYLINNNAIKCFLCFTSPNIPNTSEIIIMTT